MPEDVKEPLELVTAKNQKSLEEQARESLECWSIMGSSGQGLENQNADKNVDSEGCADEVSGRNEGSKRSWTEGCLC